METDSCSQTRRIIARRLILAKNSDDEFLCLGSYVLNTNRRLAYKVTDRKKGKEGTVYLCGKIYYVKKIVGDKLHLLPCAPSDNKANALLHSYLVLKQYRDPILFNRSKNILFGDGPFSATSESSLLPYSHSFIAGIDMGGAYGELLNSNLILAMEARGPTTLQEIINCSPTAALLGTGSDPADNFAIIISELTTIAALATLKGASFHDRGNLKNTLVTKCGEKDALVQSRMLGMNFKDHAGATVGLLLTSHVKSPYFSHQIDPDLRVLGSDSWFSWQGADTEPRGSQQASEFDRLNNWLAIASALCIMSGHSVSGSPISIFRRKPFTTIIENLTPMASLSALLLAYSMFQRFLAPETYRTKEKAPCLPPLWESKHLAKCLLIDVDFSHCGSFTSLEQIALYIQAYPERWISVSFSEKLHRKLEDGDPGSSSSNHLLDSPYVSLRRAERENRPIRSEESLLIPQTTFFEPAHQVPIMFRCAGPSRAIFRVSCYPDSGAPLRRPGDTLLCGIVSLVGFVHIYNDADICGPARAEIANVKVVALHTPGESFLTFYPRRIILHKKRKFSLERIALNKGEEIIGAYININNSDLVAH